MVLLKEKPEVLKKFYEGADLRDHISKIEENLHEVETGTILDCIIEQIPFFYTFSLTF